MIKKVVKKKFGSGSAFSSGSRAREQSPLRPFHQPKTPPCSGRCPSGNRIREWTMTIAQHEKYGKTLDQALEEAWFLYTDTSPFPSICGRVCPAPCESECNRNTLEGAVSINRIERAIGDFGVEKGLALKRLADAPNGKKIAVVGAGPAGMSAAYQLARRDYAVTVYESTDKPGGMLTWGIPGYRLPRENIEAEIQKIVDLGVEMKYNVKVGKDVTLDQLKSEYDAVFIGIGAQQGVKLGVEGEDAINVFTGVDFLARFHHGEKIDLGDKVAISVVGGGDTAIDAARICKRLGCEVTILYRRTLQEMPAIKDEIEEAQREGIKIEFLAAPVGFAKDGNRVTAMRAIRMELGEPDSSGRRRPVPIQGSEFEIPVSAVISAISQEPDFKGFEGLIEGRDWIKVDEATGLTKIDSVYAGGDVIGLDIVTTAIGHGRRAAEAIHSKLSGSPMTNGKQPPIAADRLKLDFYVRETRIEQLTRGLDARMAAVDAEVNLGLAPEQVVHEAKRCMSCGYCFDCERCWMYCQDQAIEKPMAKGELYRFKLQNCTGCKKCMEECPCGFIDMQ